jgi:sporulation protein YlmC with PRC-barrel domain
MVDTITRDESAALISADKVQGTAVYDVDNEKIGTIDDVMLTKQTGKVAYAILSFGGFLGIGEKYHPLPWSALKYDPEIGGYRVAMAGEKFRNAPAYTRADLADNRWAEAIERYYGGMTAPAA